MIALAGTWLLQADIVTVTRIPVFGEVRMTSRSVALVEIEPQGERWVARQRVCDLQMLGGGPTRTWMPEAFLEALPETTYEVRVQDGRFFADPGPSWIGQEPDGTVVDFEGDGHEGATVRIDIPILGHAELYFVQHAHTRFVGRWEEDQGASGRVEVVALEQRNLGATHRVVATERPGRVVAEESVFTLRRAPEGATCADW